MADDYRGVVGAFPYAFRASDSRLFRSYVALGGLLTVAVSLLFISAVIGVIAGTTGGRGGSLTLSRSFVALVGLFVVVPLVAPVLFVARRHRRRDPADGTYDVALAAAGYLFVLALYVGLVISVPPSQQTPPTGALASLIDVLYALPQLAGVGPPLVAAAVILLCHRRLR
jgi:ascorbate-specific PTS system EIIC-type component UlaA